jgi:uncharacterized membrane protein
MGSDFWIVVQWWGTLFLVGALAFPLTKRLFSSWHDYGYLFAKAVGMVLVTYLVYVAGVFHIAPFTTVTVLAAMGVVFAGGLVLSFPVKRGMTRAWAAIGAEELFFFLALLLWSWVKGHEPSIHALEKYMDFGFMKSILNSQYFPAPDMWYAGLPINYYYFGHTVVAVLTRISGIDLVYTFNLMLATIFALCLTMSFSIGYRITRKIWGGLLTAFLVTLAGNMQTIYAFTQGYTGDPPAGGVTPYWQLLWPIGEFLSRYTEGLERYWYANATRFIPFTIHEFPSYSFVVSDVHGHVLSIPFVLLAIALLIEIFVVKKNEARNPKLLSIMFYGVLVAVLLMTNALDGPIYLGLFLISLVVFQCYYSLLEWKQIGYIAAGVTLVAVLASIPFMSHFSSFVTGLAMNCPPAFLAGHKIGPLLFEGVEKCQHSPLWMMQLLWGFFIYCGAWLIVKKYLTNTKITQLEILLMVFFFFSILLIIFPEFFYFKDIYPAHFRSNTMFKLGYQAFIMFSIMSAYIITQRFAGRKIFFLFLIPQLFLVSIYPMFSVRSYFDSLRNYKGLDGLMWLRDQYPDDYAGIRWMNENAIQGSASKELPVLVEADGDSYTDHARFSAFSGIPAVIGWPVHEWLWRGSYDVVAPRRDEVRVIYESDDMEKTRAIIHKYGVKYIIVGGMERAKFSALNERKLKELGTVVFWQGTMQIYQL